MKTENHTICNFFEEFDIYINKSSEDIEDYFFIKKNDDTITLEANNFASAIFARNEIKKSTSHTQFFKKNKSPFKHRILFIKCSTFVSLTENLGIYLPEQLKNFNYLKVFCERILEIGYNSVVFGDFNTFETLDNTIEPYNDLIDIIDYFDKNEINLIINPVIFLTNEIKAFHHKNTAEKIKIALNEYKAFFPHIKNLFWTSLFEEDDFQYHPCGKSLTKEDKTIHEIKILQENLPNSTHLFYYIPCKNESSLIQQNFWLQNLNFEIKKNVNLVFSAVSGSPDQDHRQDHPFWKKIENSYHPSLIPILNTGGVEQGEGLWPNFPFEHSKFIELAKRHKIQGVIHLCPELPKEGSFLDLIITSAAKIMWYDITLEDALQNWILFYYPHHDITQISELLHKTRSFVLNICKSKDFLHNPNIKIESFQEEARRIGNCLLSELQLLEFYYEKIPNTSKKSLKDYFPLFIGDVKNHLKHFYTTFNVPIPSGLVNQFKENNFWISSQNSSFLKSPNIGDPGSLSHKLLWERNL